MKRFFTLLLITLGVAPLLYSQVTMTKASHGFNSGMKQEGVFVPYQSPGEPGKNCLWDFSKATAINEIKYISDLNDENFVAGKIQAIRNDGSEFFYYTTDNSNEFWGYQSGNTKLQLTEPIVKTKYPQTYNTRVAGSFAGTYTIENNGKTCIQNIEGTYSTQADATGVIVLPGNISFPALRVRTTEGTNTFEQVKYLWYVQDVRLPIFVTTEDYSIATDGTKKLMNTYSFLNTNINRVSEAKPVEDLFKVQVSPNPFRGEIQLSYSLPEKANVTVELFSSGGIKLTTLVSNQLQSDTQTLSKDISNYTQLPGYYLLKITVGDKVYTERILKSY